MRNVLVTGATGFIGNHVVNELLASNYRVIATSSSKEKAKTFSWYSEVTYRPFDFSTFDRNKNYFNFFDKPDIIIHLTWEGLPNYKSLFHFETNLQRHYELIKNLIKNGAQDVNITGTCFEYGMQSGVLNENMVTMPANPYALAKDTLRKFLQEFEKIHPFNFKWIRLFYMYGKGQNPGSLFSQLEKAIAENDSVFKMSEGEQLRDYLPVEKVAEYIVKIALQNKVKGIINCCSGNPVSIKEMVEAYVKEKKSFIQLNLGYYPYPDYEPMHFWGDNKKLTTITENENPGPKTY